MPSNRPQVYLSDAQLAARYSVNRVTIWRWLRNRPGFPQPVALSERVRRWKLSDIQDWEDTCERVEA
ncbi:MAG: AlpA family phage regulatory protein [Pseudomonadota bacterium]